MKPYKTYILAALYCLSFGCIDTPGDASTSTDATTSSLTTPTCEPGQELPVDTTNMETTWFAGNGSVEPYWVLPEGTGVFVSDNRFILVDPFNVGSGGVRLTLLDLDDENGAEVLDALNIPLFVYKEWQGSVWSIFGFDAQVFRLTDTRFAIAATQQSISIYDIENDRIEFRDQIDFQTGNPRSKDSIRAAIGTEDGLFVCTDIILLRYEVNDEGLLSFKDWTWINDKYHSCTDLAVGPKDQDQNQELWISTTGGLYTASASFKDNVEPVLSSLDFPIARIKRQDDLILSQERSRLLEGEIGDIHIHQLQDSSLTGSEETPADNASVNLLATFSSSPTRRFLGIGGVSNGVVLMTSDLEADDGGQSLEFEVYQRLENDTFQLMSNTTVAEFCCGQDFLWPAGDFVPVARENLVMLQPWRQFYNIGEFPYDGAPKRINNSQLGNSPHIFAAEIEEQEVVVALGPGVWRTYEVSKSLNSSTLSPLANGTLPSFLLPTQAVVFEPEGNVVQGILSRNDRSGHTLDQAGYDGDGPLRLGCLEITSEDNRLEVIGDLVIPAPVGRLRLIEGDLYNLLIEEGGNALRLEKYEINTSNCIGDALEVVHSEQWSLGKHGPARESYLRFDVNPSSNQIAVAFSRFDQPSQLLWRLQPAVESIGLFGISRGIKQQ